jgi:TetR/AcrR family transcriptional repressor of nem operon
VEGLSGAAFVDKFVRLYLSRQHRDLAEQGCALPAVLSELPRAGAPARRALEEELEGLVAALGPQLPVSGAEARSRALGILVACVGGLALSRAVKDEALSDEILRASRALALERPR